MSLLPERKARSSSTKQFLERNEVYFKTVTASCLTIMALVVSIGQFFTARQQFSLSELLAQMAEAQALPQFEVAIRQVRSESGSFDENRMIIDNHGGGVHEFSATAAVSIRLSTAFGTPLQTHSIDLPLVDYFPAQGVSSGGTGLLTTFIGAKNNQTLLDFERQFAEEAHVRGWSYGLSELSVFVRLHYRDLLERGHTEYFRVSGVGGGARLETPEGEAIFERWSKSTKLNLADLHADRLLDQLAKIQGK